MGDMRPKERKLRGQLQTACYVLVSVTVRRVTAGLQLQTAVAPTPSRCLPHHSPLYLHLMKLKHSHTTDESKRYWLLPT